MTLIIKIDDAGEHIVGVKCDNCGVEVKEANYILATWNWYKNTDDENLCFSCLCSFYERYRKQIHHHYN